MPITAFFGPYSPDLAGTLRTFGAGAAPTTTPTATTPASTPIFPDFKLGENNTLTPAATAPQALEASKPASCAAARASATQPAADGSSPFVDGEMLSCDPLGAPDEPASQLAGRQARC